MDSLNSDIESKQAEIRRLTETMNANPIAHERNPGEPLIMNSSDDLIRYSILRKSRDLAEIEYDILLNRKSPDRAPINLEAAEKAMAELRLGIERDKSELRS
jgi:hypothetical protein